MSHKRLRRLKIDPSLKERLLYHNFNLSKDVLSKSPYELVRQLGIGYLTANKLLRQVARACTPKHCTVLDFWRPKEQSCRYLQTSLTALDKVLHGGLPISTITEVAGPSGCGKTQFSLMLSILATLPHSRGGLDGQVVYIDTESAFSAERLVEMAQERFPEEFSEESDLLELTKKIHVMRESTCASLLLKLQNLEDFIISNNIKLIVLDSVASLVRKEFDGRLGKNMVARTNLLAKEAAILKRLAEDFAIPVFVTNQITTRYGSSPTLPENQNAEEVTTDGDPGYVTAALGNTWSHCVNTRLILQYVGGNDRQVMIAKSPIAPFSCFVYTIEACGLVLQEGGADHYDGTDPGLQKIRVRTSIPQDAFLY